MNSQDLISFQELVRRRSGLQLETMAESSLMLAVQKRMAATKADLPSAYYTRVLGDEAEFDELVSLLTINETYFYREPKQLALLTEQILPSLLAKGQALPLRILSAGCSTGEEPYSIAMAILEKFGESASRMVSITAGDIDQHALRRARHAHYPEYSFRATPAAVRERYFTPQPGGGSRLHEPVRAMVEFHALNLLASQFPEKLTDFDVIFFRNVSIYFDASTRERIQRTLHAAMRATGYLVLGTAETLANDLGVFQLCEAGGSFYFVKGAAAANLPPAVAPLIKPHLNPQSTWFPSSPHGPCRARSWPCRPSPQSILRLLPSKRRRPCHPLIRGLLPLPSSRSKPYGRNCAPGNTVRHWRGWRRCAWRPQTISNCPCWKAMPCCNRAVSPRPPGWRSRCSNATTGRSMP